MHEKERLASPSHLRQALCDGRINSHTSHCEQLQTTTSGKDSDGLSGLLSHHKSVGIAYEW